MRIPFTKFVAAAVTMVAQVAIESRLDAGLLIDNQPVTGFILGSSAYSHWGSNSQSQQLAQEFQFPTNTSITSVDWYGFFSGINVYNNDAAKTGRFTLELFANAGGIPGTLLAGTTTGTMIGTYTGVDSIVGNHVYKWSLSFNPIPLTGGETYWLGIKNPDANKNWNWSLAASDGSDTVVFRNGNAFPWNSTNLNPAGTDLQAFGFSGTSDPAPVPEPSSFVLLCLGGIGFIRSFVRYREVP